VKHLAQVPVGGKARVTTIDANDEIGMRLLEMGLTPGVEIRVLGLAPFGDPLEIELRGYRLSLRKSEASRVGVEALS
jgi:ferrous iron transport protein A